MQSKNYTKTNREFGIQVGLLFPLIAGFIIPNIFGHNFRTWTLIIGLPLFILGIFAPKTLNYPYKVWIKLG